MPRLKKRSQMMLVKKSREAHRRQKAAAIAAGLPNIRYHKPKVLYCDALGNIKAEVVLDDGPSPSQDPCENDPFQNQYGPDDDGVNEPIPIQGIHNSNTNPTSFQCTVADCQYSTTEPEELIQHYKRVHHAVIEMLDEPPPVRMGRILSRSDSDYVKALNRNRTRRYRNRQRSNLGIPKPLPGSPTKLGQIKYIARQIHITDCFKLKPVHRICFGTDGRIVNIKKNLRQFAGFPFDGSSPLYARKMGLLLKWPLVNLVEVVDLLGISFKNKRRKDVIETILQFCLCPNESKIVKVLEKPGRDRRTPVANSEINGPGTLSIPQTVPTLNLEEDYNNYKYVTIKEEVMEPEAVDETVEDVDNLGYHDAETEVYSGSDADAAETESD